MLVTHPNVSHEFEMLIIGYSNMIKKNVLGEGVKVAMYLSIYLQPCTELRSVGLVVILSSNWLCLKVDLV